MDGISDLALQIILDAVSGNRGVTLHRGAAQHIRDILYGTMLLVLRDAVDLVTHARQTTLDPRAIQTAVERLLPRDLGLHAVSEGTKALDRERARSNELNPRELTPWLRQHTANHPLPPRSVLYLVAVASYLAAELLELSSAGDRAHVTHDDVAHVLSNDDELGALLFRLSAVMP